MQIPGLKHPILIAAGALFLIFLVQNLAVVEVNFLFWGLRLPRALIYVLVFALGAIAAASALYLQGTRKKPPER